MANRIEEDRAKAQGEHQVENDKGRILNEETADDGAQEVQRQHPFKDGRPRQLLCSGSCA